MYHTAKRFHRAFLEFLDPRDNVYQLFKMMPPGIRRRKRWCLHFLKEQSKTRRRRLQKEDQVKRS